MSSLEKDVETLELALRLFFQTMKRPQMWAVITAAAGVNIDRPAAIILQTLMLHEPKHCRVQDLANQLGIEAPSVTRKTQELEQAGYIKRLPDPDDKRAIGLHTTERGREVAGRLWEVQRHTMSAVLADWPSNDREQFVKLFQRYSADLAKTYNFTNKELRS